MNMLASVYNKIYKLSEDGYFQKRSIAEPVCKELTLKR